MSLHITGDAQGISSDSSSSVNFSSETGPAGDSKDADSSQVLKIARFEGRGMMV